MAAVGSWPQVRHDCALDAAGFCPLQPPRFALDADAAQGCAELTAAEAWGLAAPEGDPGTSVLPHTDDDPEVEDAWRRRFMPAGVVLRTELDPHHWLTVGAGEELPVHFAGSTVLLSEGSVPARFAASERAASASASS